MYCKNCGHEISSPFCPACGHPAQLRRIDGRYILQEIGSVLNVERGFLYTTRELFIKPGQTIRSFLLDNRSRLVKPIVFIIITSLIYSLANHYFRFEDGYVQYQDSQDATSSKIFKWVQGNYGYANILMSLFIAVCIKLFFRTFKYTYVEILVLLCYIMGVGMLLFSLFGIVQGLSQIRLMQVAGIAGFIYTTWGIGQFFGGKVMHYIIAFLAYISGMITFALTVIAIGTLVDMMIKT